MRFKAIFFIAVFCKQLFDFICIERLLARKSCVADFTSPPFKTARTASIPHEDISFQAPLFSELFCKPLHEPAPLFSRLWCAFLPFCFCRSVNFFTVSHLYHHTKYCRLYLISANHLYYMMCWRHSCFRLYAYTYRVCCQICLNRQRCKFHLNSSALKFRLCI